MEKDRRLYFRAAMLLLALFTTATAWAGDVTVTSETTAWTDGNTYNVTSDVTIDTRISVSGTVTLNLGAGATLTAGKGIYVSEGNTLTIEGSGALMAGESCDNDHAGIGGNYGDKTGGNIVINGGVITATGGKNGAGIGAVKFGSGANITINGGKVTAAGGENAPGIGVMGSFVTINGGEVTATGGYYGAGIGGEYYGAGGNITITGGVVNATGGLDGAGIGGGNYGAGGNITITGGVITATGGPGGAGIGGGSNRAGGNITINGGEVTATGVSWGAGIGGGSIGAAGTIVINGGQVTAIAETLGAGIGRGGAGATDSGTLTLGWTDLHNDFIEAKRWSNREGPIDGFSSISFADGKLFLLSGTTTQATSENINPVSADIKLIPTKEIVDISNATIDGVSTHYTYTGDNIDITPIVTLAGETLTATTDYTIGFTKDGTAVENVNGVGIYSLTVAGTGFYSGSKSFLFYVNAPVDYQAYESGSLTDKTLAATAYDRVSSMTTTMSAGWYVVSDNVTVSDRISVSGDVHLVLCDGATLTAQTGISVTDGNSLTIYSQSGNTGKLVATVPAGNETHYLAAIGGDRYGNIHDAGTPVKAGSITIHGGDITATAYFSAAGIGKAYEGKAGNITIYGGKVTASCDGESGIGIGGDEAVIQLGYARTDDYIQSLGYIGSVTVASDRKFATDDATPVDISGSVINLSSINGKKLTPKTYTVSFSLGYDGGTAPVAQTVYHGLTKATAPTAPTRTGYDFGGWKNGGAAYDFAAAVTSDLTLTAAWTPIEYTITYYGVDGATFATANPTTYTIEDAITLNNPTMTGYTFTGWTGSNGDTPQTSVSIATGSHEDKTYTANWKKLLSNADIAIIDIAAQKYDGTALTPVLTVSDGQTPLVKGKDYTVSPETAIDAGTYTLTLTGIGAYDGTATRQFTVSRRAVTLTSATDEKTYDGTALTADGVTEGGDGFAQGEGATYSVTGTQTNAGSSANTFTYTLNDGTKAANYDITIANGTLTINPASVTLTANSDTKEYSGAEQTVEGFTSSVDGLTFTSVTASGSGTDTGTYDVTFTGVTLNTTKDNTGNYVVTGTTDGTLTITVKTVTDNNALKITQDENGYYATFTGSANDEVSIPEAITVKEVTLERNFSNGKYATLMLPFTMTNTMTLSGANIYQFVGVEKENGQWIATMQTPTSPLQANTPYLVEPVTSDLTDGKLTFGLNGGTVTLNTTTAGEDSNEKDDLWDFIGTYSYIKWTSDTGDQDYSAEREAEIGKVYGFAAVEKTGIRVGDFVRVASGAKIRPMCAYLKWKGSIPNNARALTRAATNDDTELPQRITVKLVSASGETTAIGTLDTTTGEVSFDSEAWYTLDGVRLSGKPSSKGIYINNGKKIVIK